MAKKQGIKHRIGTAHPVIIYTATLDCERILTDIGDNTAHVIIAAFFSIAIIAITAVEMYFDQNMSTSQLLMVAIQDIGLGFANSWFMGKITATQTSVIVDTNPPKPNTP